MYKLKIVMKHVILKQNAKLQSLVGSNWQYAMIYVHNFKILFMNTRVSKIAWNINLGKDSAKKQSNF